LEELLEELERREDESIEEYEDRIEEHEDRIEEIKEGAVEQNYEWVLGATAVHCSDCLRLNGQVHSASEWRAAGISPQSPDLECGGWNCDCRLYPVDAPSIGMDF
jgi:hypothetical protein